MLRLILLNVLLVNSILTLNDINFTSGWMPLVKLNPVDGIRRSYIETRQSIWKPSQYYNHNTDDDKDQAIQVIYPQQAEHQIIVPTVEAASTVIPNINNSPVEKDSIQSTESTGQMNSTIQILNETNETNVLTEKLKRKFKQSRSLSSVVDIIFAAVNKTRTNAEADETRISLKFKNVPDNNYEVIEPSLQQESQTQNLGYIYQRPTSPGTSAYQNEYTNKFVTLLSKYNIKENESLKNYAYSKLHQNNLLKPSHQHPHSRSGFPIPYSFNSLNHYPLDPVLAVLLSNYGYYLRGFYGLPNNFKNLYGYAASNNIHNNKPFGSYKIYSDTDSSN